MTDDRIAQLEQLANRIVGIVADAMDGQGYSHTETVQVILPMLQHALAAKEALCQQLQARVGELEKR